MSSLNLGGEVQQDVDGARGSVMASNFSSHYPAFPPIAAASKNRALATGNLYGGDRKSEEPSHAPSKTSLPLRRTISITALPSSTSCTGEEVKQFEGGEEVATCRQQSVLLGGPRGDHAPPLPPQLHSGKSIAGECRRQEDTDAAAAAALIGRAVARVEVSCPLGVIKTGRNRTRGD